MLGLHQNAGVTKKSRRGRKAVLSTRARKRHEKGLERAEEIVDRTANKVAKSKRAASNIADRKKAWDDVNGSVTKVGDTASSSSNMFAGLEADGQEEEEGGVEKLDDEMVSDVPAAIGAAVAPSAPDDDDEIL